MITFLLGLLALCMLCLALFVSATIFSILFFVFAIILLMTCLAYIGIALVPSICLLAYVGIAIILLFLAKFFISGTVWSLKYAISFIVGLACVLALCYAIGNSNDIYMYKAQLYYFDRNLDVLLICAILVVCVICAMLYKKQNAKDATRRIDDGNNGE